MTSLKIIFAGTPEFAVPSLAALIAAGLKPVAVYTQPDRPAGRGQKLQMSPVKQLAQTSGILVIQPASLKKDPDAVAQLRALDADLMVVVAYGLLLPVSVLEAPRLGCVNVHASLLPRWRGAAPIQRAILAGDGETGVTIMQMDEGLDTGAMLLAESVPIAADTDAAGLHDRLAVLGARLIVTALVDLDRLTPVLQPQQGVTYAHKLAKDEGRLDWSRPAAELERQVRGLTPWPGVWCQGGGERLKVLRAAVAHGKEGATPGTVLDEALTVACGGGTALRLLRVQRPGKSAMETADLLRGWPIAASSRLD